MILASQDGSANEGFGHGLSSSNEDSLSSHAVLRWSMTISGLLVSTY